MTAAPHKILVVDDDVDTCHNLKDILTDFGHEVDFAHDGLTALAMVREKPYDVALLDFKMPGMDGLTLYRKIRQLRAATVAMVVTAYATPETRQEALQAGTWKVLSKPVDLNRLMEYVEQALDQPLVMVVDGDRELCDNLWKLLRDANYRVALAHNEPEAEMQLGEKNDYEVVLIDLKLPGGDGRQVLERVRSLSPQSRTVLITGQRSESEQSVEKAMTEGADALCYKPFDVPQLLKTISNLSERRGRI